MGISQVQGGATNAVQAWTKKQDLPRILTTSRRCYELLNRSVIRHWLHVIIILTRRFVLPWIAACKDFCNLHTDELN